MDRVKYHLGHETRSVPYFFERFFNRHACKMTFFCRIFNRMSSSSLKTERLIFLLQNEIWVLAQSPVFFSFFFLPGNRTKKFSFEFDHDKLAKNHDITFFIYFCDITFLVCRGKIHDAYLWEKAFFPLVIKYDDSCSRTVESLEDLI